MPALRPPNLCSTNIEPERDIMTIGREFLITVEMGKACPAGRKLVAAGLDASLSAAKHCYLALFVLWDRRNAASFFQPYYRILPAEFPNMPIFWDEETVRLRFRVPCLCAVPPANSNRVSWSSIRLLLLIWESDEALCELVLRGVALICTLF
jgi:hypothetical protein